MNQHDEKQQEIEIEMAMVAIAKALIIYYDERPWHDESLAAHTGYSMQTISDAAHMLVELELVNIEGGIVVPTYSIAEWYESQIRNSAVDVGMSALDFANEALTGTDEHGKQSTISRAALPSGAWYRERNRAEDDMISVADRVEEIAHIAGSLGLDVADTVEYMQSGQVHWCSGVDSDGHWGEFGKKAGRWQNLCKKCRSVQYRRRLS